MASSSCSSGPVRGFKTLKTAYATIKGFEVMRALRKGQAQMFAIQGGIVGEARIVERAFGVGPCVLTKTMTLLQDRLASAETWSTTFSCLDHFASSSGLQQSLPVCTSINQAIAQLDVGHQPSDLIPSDSI